MKSKFLTLTLLMVLGCTLCAQSAKTERMQRREARRARQAAELAQSRAEMIKLVKDTTFVLEANTFIGPFGQESPVSSFQNYFAIIGDKVAISMAFNNPPSYMPPASATAPLAWYGPGVPGIGPGYSSPGFPGWNWQSWDTPNTPATLVSYMPDMSDPDGPFVISGSFRTWTGVIPVSFKMYIQADGTGRIIFYSNDGGQVTFTGDIVSPDNASTIYPLP